MGNCCKQGQDPYLVPEATNDKKLMVSAESYDKACNNSTFAESGNLVDLKTLNKVESSLSIQPGEENLFSKQINIDAFQIEKVLGRGNFGKVYLGMKIDTGKYYAIKEIKKMSLTGSREKANTIFERVILENVDSPFIVKMHYAFQTPDKLYYVLDFCKGGELFFHLNKQRTFSEKRARFYAAECILALEELHRHNIIYRDLKPENILLDGDGHIMLTDFGLSKYNKGANSKLFTFAGTPEYLAPEIIKEKGYSKEVDWWSLGAILYEMIIGVQPFHHQNQQRLLDNILGQDIRFPDWVSSSAKDLLEKLLGRNPKMRLGCDDGDANNIKKHKFFKGINWDKLARKEIKAPFKPKLTTDCDSSNFDTQFTNQRTDDTEVTPSRSIKEKRDTYIRDFTYYRSPGQTSGADIDIEKLLEINLASVGLPADQPFANLEAITEDNGDLNSSYISKRS